jgi:IS30 family transposase
LLELQMRDMSRDERTVPTTVRDEQIAALARRRMSVRQIAREVGVPKSTVQEVVRKWRDPTYVRRRTDTNADDSISAFYA